MGYVLGKVLGIIGACAIFAIVICDIKKSGGAIEYLKDDWQFRLPYRLRHNRYRGLSKSAYKLLCLIYYSIKTILIGFFSLAFCFYKFIFWDLWIWIFKKKAPDWFYNFFYDNTAEYEEDLYESTEDDDANLLYNAVISVENMSGIEFEYFCANLLRANGYTDVQVTSKSGDQGVDILAEKDEQTWAFQCKHYSQPVGNLAVREVFAGIAFYHCDIGVVITNNTFTSKAKEFAKETGILLWDQDKLYTLMEKYFETYPYGDR